MNLLLSPRAGIVLAFFLSACASSAPTAVEPTTTARIDAMLDDTLFENSFWGAKIVDLQSGETLYERNAGKSFVPASNMKLYTTAAGLDHLGPDFHWVTSVFTEGRIENDTLFGNVIIRGSGDPSIGGRFTDGDLTATFRSWADSLKAAGVMVVTGDVIGDDDVFDDIPLGPGWMWDDETTWYSAELGALTFNDNCVDLTVEGTIPSDTASLYWEPLQTDYITVINQSQTVDPDSSSQADYHRRRASNTIEINTRVRPGETITRSITITNATLYFAHVVRQVFLLEGIKVTGEARDVDEFFHKPVYEDSGTRKIATYVSPPLSEIAAVINKPSHNLYAEQLLKSLPVYTSKIAPAAVSTAGVAFFDPSSSRPEGTTTGGATLVYATLAEAGADTSGVIVADGSGLSRYNLITPEATVDLLTYMWAHPDTAVAGAFVRSLPVGGIDGTIENLVTEGPAVGNLRAKTGTLRNHRLLSGYIATSSGRPLVFSLISNNYTVPTSEVNKVQRMLVNLLASL